MLWFWLVEGLCDFVDDLVMWVFVVMWFCEFGRYVGEVGFWVLFEMYEDIYFGIVDFVVWLVEEIGFDNVGFNLDIGNFVCFYCFIEDWCEVYVKMFFYVNYWYVKNYMCDEMFDGLCVISVLLMMVLGLIDYCYVI